MAAGNINIRAIIKDITNQSVYYSVIEGIVNSIQAVNEKLDGERKILIKLYRSGQSGSINADNNEEDEVNDIEGFDIIDSGIGFNTRNQLSFQTYRSDYKEKLGGKGFGRFFYLKFFDDVSFQSIYEESGEKFKITFSFGYDDMMENKVIIPVSKESPTGTVLSLRGLKKKYITTLNSKSKKVETFSRKILEHLLIYFVEDSLASAIPNITISDGSESRDLKDLIGDDKDISVLHSDTFNVTRKGISGKGSEVFNIKVFKVSYSTLSNSISLCADNRVVEEKNLGSIIADFQSTFKDQKGNYVIKAYVTGEYLNKYVTPDRLKFDFLSNEDPFEDPIIDKDILLKAAEKLKTKYREYLEKLKTKKDGIVQEYVSTKAPWYKLLIKDIDTDEFDELISDDELDKRFHHIKYKRELRVKEHSKDILSKTNLTTNDVKELVSGIDEICQIELVHYIANRRIVLDLLRKSLEIKDNEKYETEGKVHSIIFPTRADTEDTPYDNHNLWILDERLNFTEFLASDKPLNGGNTERVDLISYGKRIAFRGENENHTPVIIFEFKRPNLENFINEGFEEDPIEQIERYVKSLLKGDYKTPKGKTINVQNGTPFYGYIVCELTPKVKEWFIQKDFTILPDGKGYYKYHKNLNIYMEVMSWDKVVSDAEMRNRVFFDKLKI